MGKEIGDSGERLVAELLRNNGWEILATQWRCKWGELDLIACDRQWLLFVEVKTRCAHNWDADGSLAITYQKQAKIIKSASVYLEKHPKLAELSCRFDVALVRRKKQIQSQSDQTYQSVAEFYLQTYIEQAFVT